MAECNDVRTQLPIVASLPRKDSPDFGYGLPPDRGGDEDRSTPLQENFIERGVQTLS
jgi:hypothetical protein